LWLEALTVYPALLFGLVRLIGRKRLIPQSRGLIRRLYLIQGPLALWTTFLMFSVDYDSVQLVGMYLFFLTFRAFLLPFIAADQEPPGRSRNSIWLVRSIAIIAAVMSLLSPQKILFAEAWDCAPPYLVLLSQGVWLGAITALKKTVSAQLASLQAAAGALLGYIGWYFDSWSFVRSYPNHPEVTYCMGLLDGGFWDAALLGVLLILLIIQFWRLRPAIAVRLRS